ncbi:MAG: aminotransferase class V-fold PLP-dependent enzyme, partial [Rhizobiales bacterium]|nr:aminotransferase class V-fold PLP-dependent enzyme [Hyphomicrobiales bacterium]
MTIPKKPRGRLFFANPGPTNIPDSILHAQAHFTVDFMDADFIELYNHCFDGLKKVVKTNQHLFFYAGSGHAAWEASLVNLFSPNDRLLILETGHFSEKWGEMARAHGLDVQTVPSEWNKGADYDGLKAALEADTGHVIKVVGCVHNETSTGMVMDLPRVRAILDAAKHPALLLADTISSLGSLDFRMDEWGIDCAVGGSQKGLMMHTGLSFTAISDKAMKAHQVSTCPKHYFNWTVMLARPHKSFLGTVPTSFFFGLKESLRLLLEEEGMDNVVSRHARLGEAVRRAVQHWSGNQGPRLFSDDPARYSNSVTAVRMPEGFNADDIRKTAMNRFNVSLGGGLSRLSGQVFRIGHMGDLNEPMIL